MNQIQPCHMCIDARIDDELNDNNDFSTFTIGYNKSGYRIMLESGSGKPVRLSFEIWNGKRWTTACTYTPHFCPNCGRKLSEYE